MINMSINPQRHRRLIEVGFWLAFLGSNAVVEALSVITEYGRANRPLENWEPFCLGVFQRGFYRLARDRNREAESGLSVYRQILAIAVGRRS